jgi:hypothetical protein
VRGAEAATLPDVFCFAKRGRLKEAGWLGSMSYARTIREPQTDAPAIDCGKVHAQAEKEKRFRLVATVVRGSS